MITVRFHGAQEFQLPIPARKGFPALQLSSAARSLRQRGYGGQAATANLARKVRMRGFQALQASQRHHIDRHDANGRACFAVDKCLANLTAFARGVVFGLASRGDFMSALCTIGKSRYNREGLWHSLKAGDKGFGVHDHLHLFDELTIGPLALISQGEISL